MKELDSLIKEINSIKSEQQKLSQETSAIIKKGCGGRFLLVVSLIGLTAWLIHSLFPEMYPLTIMWAAVLFLILFGWILQGDEYKE